MPGARTRIRLGPNEFLHRPSKPLKMPWNYGWPDARRDDTVPEFTAPSARWNRANVTLEHVSSLVTPEYQSYQIS